MDLLQTKSEAAHAVEDLVRRLDPLERRTAVVMRVHVRSIRSRAERRRDPAPDVGACIGRSPCLRRGSFGTLDGTMRRICREVISETT
jgi:hypothetical protein